MATATRGNYQSVYNRLGSVSDIQIPATYTVRGNDTIFSIAMTVFDTGYDSSLWRLLASYNNISDLDSVTAGTVLLIPPDSLIGSND